MRRTMAMLLGLVALVTSCTSAPQDPGPGPTSTPTATATEPVGRAGDRVAVVVDPVLAGEWIEAALSDLPDALLDGRRVRVVTADGAVFVRDLAELFTTEGYELVCVLGPDAAAVVAAVAPTSPSTRYCAAPTDAADLPPNVLPVDLRFEELGHLAGVALGTDLDAGPVTVIPGPDTVLPVARIRAGVQEGLRQAGVLPPTVLLAGPVTDEEGAADAARAAVEGGTRGIVSLAGALDPALRDVVVDTPVSLPTPTETPNPQPTDQAPAQPAPGPTGPVHASLVGSPALATDDGLAPVVLLTFDLHLDRAVRVALQRSLDGWDPTPASLGVADDAISVTVNPDARTPRVTAVVDQEVQLMREAPGPTPTE